MPVPPVTLTGVDPKLTVALPVASTRTPTLLVLPVVVLPLTLMPPMLPLKVWLPRLTVASPPMAISSMPASAKLPLTLIETPSPPVIEALEPAMSKMPAEKPDPLVELPTLIVVWLPSTMLVLLPIVMMPVSPKAGGSDRADVDRAADVGGHVGGAGEVDRREAVVEGEDR